MARFIDPGFSGAAFHAAQHPGNAARGRLADGGMMKMCR